MEKKNLKLKNNFTQLITHVSKFYKDVSSNENEAYYLGKKEAYEEIVKKKFGKKFFQRITLIFLPPCPSAIETIQAKFLGRS